MNVGQIGIFDLGNGDFIDDMRMTAVEQAIDGEFGILGSAGPTLLRSSDGLPVGGQMTFDSADIDRLINDSPNGLDFFETVLHEMGHIQGIGTRVSLQRQNIRGFLPRPVIQQSSSYTCVLASVAIGYQVWYRLSP